MPLVRNVISGGQVLASAKIARRFPLVVLQGTTSGVNLAELQSNTLPACVWYCVMAAGPAGCTFNPLFAVDNLAAQPRYFPVTIPQAVILGTPLLVATRLICNMIGATFTVPAGGPNATVDVILAASM